MPFPELKLATRQTTQSRRVRPLNLIEQPALVSGTGWAWYTATLGTLPDTAAIQVYWVSTWNSGYVLEIGPTSLSPVPLVVPNPLDQPVTIAGPFALGLNAINLGQVTDAVGTAGAGLQLGSNSATGANVWIGTDTVLPVESGKLYTLGVGLRRVSGTPDRGFIFDIVEYPGFGGRETSEGRRQAVQDPTIRKEIEGGWTVTRPRFTRRPRKTFTTAFKDLSQADMEMFMNWYDQKRGGSGSFTWVDPADGVHRTVRFAEPPEVVYAGAGALRRWDIPSIKLEEV